MKPSGMAVITIIGALGFAGAALAQNGGAIYQSSGCAACHGSNGNTPLMPTYPKLAGQYPQYLFNQMKDIQTGVRNNGQAAMMRPTVANISDQDLQAIAQWLSRQPAK